MTVEIGAGIHLNGILLAEEAEIVGKRLFRRHFSATDEHREKIGAGSQAQFDFEANEIALLLDAAWPLVGRPVPRGPDDRNDDAAASHGPSDKGGELGRNRDAGDVYKYRCFPVAGPQASDDVAGDRIRILASVGHEDGRHQPVRFGKLDAASTIGRRG